MNFEHLKKVSVLVVDDNPGILDGMKIMLESHVKELHTASDGEEGFKIYQVHHPDIIVSDIQMPHMNGIELAKQIKQENEEAYVILITAFGDENYLMQAIEVSADAYFKKPLSPLTVLKKLDQFALSIHAKELTRHEEQLRLQNQLIQAKVEIIRDIAHHWRQPINAINIMFEGILDYMEHDLDIHDTYLQENTNKISHLLQDVSHSIQKFQKLYKKSGGLPETTLIPKLVQEILDIFHPGFIKCNLSPTLQIDPSLNSCHVPVSFNDSFITIIKNALEACEKHSPEAPELIIRGQASRDKIILRVSDNFGGISKEILDTLFQPYATTKFHSAGTGLSLFFAKSLIEGELEGRLEVSNRDQGAEFMIELPLRAHSH